MRCALADPDLQSMSLLTGLLEASLRDSRGAIQHVGLPGPAAPTFPLCSQRSRLTPKPPPSLLGPKASPRPPPPTHSPPRSPAGCPRAPHARTQGLTDGGKEGGREEGRREGPSAHTPAPGPSRRRRGRPPATHRSRVRPRRGRHRVPRAPLSARTRLTGPPPPGTGRDGAPRPRTERGRRGHLGAGPSAPRRGPWRVPRRSWGRPFLATVLLGFRPSTHAAGAPNSSLRGQKGPTGPARAQYVMAPAPEVPSLRDGRLETPCSERP